MNVKSFAFRKLQIRGYLACALKELLLEKGYEIEEIDPLIEELKTQGYLDDRAYIESVIRREKRARHGPLWIKHKLCSLGADAHLVEELVEENYSEEERIEVIDRFLDKNAKKEKKKVISSLSRRGFSISEILKVCYNNN